MNASSLRPVRRRVTTLVILVLAVVLVGSGTTPATAAKKKPAKPAVTLTAPTSGKVGAKLKIRANVKRGLSGQKIRLQHRDAKKWTTVAVRKLPPKAKKGIRKVTFTITPKTSGKHVYRAVLAKKKTKKKAAAKAVSKQITVRVTPRQMDPPSTTALTLTTTTSTKNEQTQVTFSGTLKHYRPSTVVVLQYSRGPSPAESAWQDARSVTATGSGATLTYAGNVTIPVLRNVAGAPQLNLRAKVAAAGSDPGAVSKPVAYLIHTRYDGIANHYVNGEPHSQYPLVVIYSDRWWRMVMGAIHVQGKTDGWDLVDTDGLRFNATHHKPGRICRPNDPDDPGAGQTCQGDDNLPWVSYKATWGGGDHVIEAYAIYLP